MAKSGPVPMLDLRDYVPPSDEWRFRLIRRLVDEAGAGPGQAWSLLETLDRIEQTGDDGLGSAPAAHVKRSQYRRMLSRLGAPPWDGSRVEDKGAYIESLDGRRRRSGRLDRRGIRWTGARNSIAA